MSEALLDIRELTVEFGPVERPLRVVDRVSFTVRAGETVGVVGESGSGKSMTALSVLRLVPEPPARVSGQILFDGRDLMKVPKREMPKVRGKDIGMIFQEPMSSLNPLMTIGDQIDEAIMLHEPLSAAERRERVLALLRLVGMPDPENRLRAYPDQFSGGMRQRVMAAIAMACNPRLLIADEPTTALDVTIEAQILELLTDLQSEFNMAIMYISHDLAVVGGLADEVMVMYLGLVMEHASADELFENPLHPYTQALWRSIPKIDGPLEPLVPVSGALPSPFAVHRGCPFYARCDQRIPGVCDAARPPLIEVTQGHKVRCFLYSEDHKT